jgi:hypothetical protein
MKDRYKMGLKWMKTGSKMGEKWNKMDGRWMNRRMKRWMEDGCQMDDHQVCNASVWCSFAKVNTDYVRSIDASIAYAFG